MPVNTATAWRIALYCAIPLAACAIAFFRSQTFQIAMYKRLPLGGSFDRYTRLTKYLRIGMSPSQVQAVLGPPESIQTFTNGVRWLYNEVGATSGWEYVAEFQNSKGSPELTYLRNVEHVVFPSSRRLEVGTRLNAPQFPLGD